MRHGDCDNASNSLRRVLREVASKREIERRALWHGDNSMAADKVMKTKWRLKIRLWRPESITRQYENRNTYHKSGGVRRGAIVVRNEIETSGAHCEPVSGSPLTNLLKRLKGPICGLLENEIIFVNLCLARHRH